MIPVNALQKFLTDTGVLSSDQFEAYKKDALATKVDLEDLLIESKVLTEVQLLNFKGEMTGIPTIDLRSSSIEIDTSVLNLIPEPIARRHQMIAFKKEKDTLSVAMFDPDDLQTREFIKKKTGLAIKTFVTNKKSIDFGLTKYHGSIESEFSNLIKESSAGGGIAAAAGSGAPKSDLEIAEA